MKEVELKGHSLSGKSENDVTMQLNGSGSLRFRVISPSEDSKSSGGVDVTCRIYPAFHVIIQIKRCSLRVH